MTDSVETFTLSGPDAGGHVTSESILTASDSTKLKRRGLKIRHEMANSNSVGRFVP